MVWYTSDEGDSSADQRKTTDAHHGAGRKLELLLTAHSINRGCCSTSSSTRSCSTSRLPRTKNTRRTVCLSFQRNNNLLFLTTTYY